MDELTNSIENLITKFRDLCDEENTFDEIDTKSHVQKYFEEMKELTIHTEKYKDLPADLVFALTTWGYKVMYRYLDQLNAEDQTFLIIKELIGHGEPNWENLEVLLEGTPLQVEFGAPINDSYAERKTGATKEGSSGNITNRNTQRKRKQAETLLANDSEIETVLDTNKELSNMHRQLKQIFKDNGNQPISYYRIIIDPEAFYITCHNALVLTLLLQLHEVEFLSDENNDTVVRMITTAKKPEFAGKEHKMAVASFTPLSWKEKIRQLNITRPLLNTENRKKEHIEAYNQTDASEETFEAIFGKVQHGTTIQE